LDLSYAKSLLVYLSAFSSPDADFLSFYSKLNHYQVPGIVFARGPAVAVLILLESEGETYAVLTEQVDVGFLQCLFYSC
jgi:hypothetical protein